MTSLEIAALLVENTRLREANATLTDAIAEARAETAAHRKVAEANARQVQRLVEQVNELTAMLRRFMTAKDVARLAAQPEPDGPDPDSAADPPPAGPAPDGPAPDGPNSGHPTGGSATGASEPSESSGESGNKDPNPRPKGEGKAGRRHPKASLPGETQKLAAPGRCVYCDSPRLLARDTEVSVKFTAVTGFVRRKEIQREVCVCADCNRRNTAPMPPMPWENSSFTPELVAFVVYMKFVQLVPLDRLHQALKRQGVNLAWSSMVYLIERAARLFDPIDGEHWRQLKAGPQIGIDGTGLSVVVLGLPSVWKGYLDIFCRHHLHVFQYSATKHASLLEEQLGCYAGTVVCDAEFRMDQLFRAGRQEANCNAHPRRKFLDAIRTQPDRARAGKDFIDRMYDVEREAKAQGLTGADLLALRTTRTRPIAEAFRVWLDATEAELVLPTDPLRKVIRYYKRHFDALTRFISDASLPIDNNLAERGFQMHAKLRINAEFAGSPEGAHRWATLLGVVTTAKRLGVDVLAYLTWAIERLGTWKKVFNLPVAQLTPEAYKRRGDNAVVRAA